MVDVFAVALEPEMARFYDPGVDRADGHFVYLRAAHLEIVRHADQIGIYTEDPAIRSIG